MNKMIRFGGAMALLWAATGCVNEAPDYAEPIDPEATETGFLSLADIGLYVVVDSETDQNTEESPTAMLTRAEGGTTDPATGGTTGEEIDSTTGVVEGAEALDKDGYIVKICAKGVAEPEFEGTYAELKEKLGPEKNVLEVPVGTYDISATSNKKEAVPAGVQARPSYAGKVSGVDVRKGQTADVDPITCKLQNIKITVGVAADLYDQLVVLEGKQTKIEAMVYYGDEKDKSTINWEVPATWNWTAETPTPVYFPALKEEKTLHFWFRAQKEGEAPIEMNKDISSVMEGQWRRIHVIPKYDTTGNLTFDVTVSAFVQDQEITVGDDGKATVSMCWMEQPYVDPDDPSMARPSIKWADGSDLPETIPADGAAPQQVTIAAPNLIERVALTVRTTNPEFTADASAMTTTDLCAVASSRQLTNYGIPFGAALKDQASVSFGLDKILGQIRGYDGEYTFVFAVTDRSGFICEQTLRFVSGGGAVPAGPTIDWEGGTLYNDEGFNPDGSEKPGAEYVEMYDGMQIDIKLAADPHFESIKVKISSPVLTADLLAAANLSPEFDLCNLQDFTDSEGVLHTAESQGLTLTLKDPPADDKNLPVLGLIDKVDDDLKAESAASFNITGFVSMMNILGANAKFQFALTVVDAEGRSTTKYLRLQNPAGE